VGGGKYSKDNYKRETFYLTRRSAIAFLSRQEVELSTQQSANGWICRACTEQYNKYTVVHVTPMEQEIAHWPAILYYKFEIMFHSGAV